MLRNELQNNTADLTARLCFGYDQFENSCSHVFSSSVRIPLGKLPGLWKISEENMTNLCKSFSSFTYQLTGPK